MTKNHTFQNAKIEEFVKKKKKLTLKEFVDFQCFFLLSTNPMEIPEPHIKMNWVS